MGIDPKHPPLPAPTESSIENRSELAPTDLATDISRRTDKTSFSIPEDGSPITLSTRKLNLGRGGASDASLLIEYFEVARTESGKPSVRVKITPSNKKDRDIGSFLAEPRTHRSRPSVRQSRSSDFSRAQSHEDLVSQPLEWSNFELGGGGGGGIKGSDDSAGEEFQPQYLNLTSEISSMPADSMIDGTLVSRASAKNQASGPKSHERMEQEPTHMDTLKAPSRSRSRSASKERITQKVLEKLAREQSPGPQAPLAVSRKRRPTSSSKDLSSEHPKPWNRKSSHSHVDDDEASITESSVVNARDRDSSISGMSKSSLNPKLLQTVEDVVRRLILPEIETIKRQQSTREGSSNVASRVTSRSSERKMSDGNHSRPASATPMKSMEILKREKDLPDHSPTGHAVRHKKHRRSSKEISETKSRNLNRSLESMSEGKEASRKLEANKLTGGSKTLLTVAALNSQASRSSLDSLERDKRQRRKQRSQSHDQSPSTVPSDYKDNRTLKDVPNMPMQSEIADSDLTRESILSAETVDANSFFSTRFDEPLPRVHEVVRRSPADQTSILTSSPLSHRSNNDLKTTKMEKNLTSRRSDKSLSSNGHKAALMAAGFGAGSSALYGHVRKSSRANDREHKYDSGNKKIHRQETAQGPNEGTNNSTELLTSSDVSKDKTTAKLASDAILHPRSPTLSQGRDTLRQDRNETFRTELPTSFDPSNPQERQNTSSDITQPDLVSYHQPVESQVASLLDPSNVGSLAEQSDKDEYDPSAHEHNVHERNSAERWANLRGNAQQRSTDALSSGTFDSGYHVSNSHRDIVREMQSSQIDAATAPEQFNHERDPSILEGQLGDEEETRGQWPYEPTPPAQSVGSAFSYNEPVQDHSMDLPGTPSGLGIAADARALSDSSKGAQYVHAPMQPRNTSPSTPRVERSHIHAFQPDAIRFATEKEDKHELFGVNPQPSAATSPLSFSKATPRLFESDRHNLPSYTKGQRGPEAHRKTFSMDSATKSPLYDSSTGRGVNNIQSRDVVALMDHLTVRDGQRNARDTEILVTLVRSAAEMRNSFEDMKRFVEAQNQMNSQRGDLAADRSFSNAPNVRNGQSHSSSPRMTRSSTAAEDSPSKKKNILQRALKGLSGKNTTDLSHMQDMLVQILEEVEALRAAQAAAQLPSQEQREFNRIERTLPETGAARAADAPTKTLHSKTDGSEPGLASSRYSKAPQSQNQLHVSHEDVARPNDWAQGGFDEDEEWGPPTPSNEPRTVTEQVEDKTTTHKAQSLSVDTPAFTDSQGGHVRHKSTGSSLFAIPKISRWSKTTTSSVPNTPNYRSQRSSQQTRWGSDVHDESEYFRKSTEGGFEAPNAQSPVRVNEYDDRSASPLIPESQISFEEAKYQANRHSLTLQHPQPRQGPNQNQRSLMETQARAYGGLSPETGPVSPQSDAFGSFPAFARVNRFSVIQDNRPATLSPVSSGDESTAFRTRNPVTEPLVPAQYRGASLRSHEGKSEDAYSSDAHSDDFDNDNDNDNDNNNNNNISQEQWIEPVPLARKQSPYSPGGLLAPIEERYSLEQTRSSISATPAQDRLSISGDRSNTPQQAPRAAFGGKESPASRKIAGPREMPARPRVGSR